MRWRLNRYILGEIVGPLCLGFLVYTFILLIRFLFQSAEMIIRRGVPVSTVGRLLLLSLPNIVVLTLPMSLLFGILIAVGRLSSDSELVAMRSCGISLVTLYRPILFISGVFTLLNIFLMVYALPWGNHSLQELRLEILTQSVSQQVQPRVFYEEWPGKVIYVFETPPGESRWKGVFLAESIPSSDNNQVTIADWGEVKVDDAGERVVLQLFNAVRHKLDLHSPTKYETSQHGRLDLVLEDRFTSDQKARISISKGIRELTLGELQDLLADPATSSEQRNLARIEIHKKFSIPAACLVFGLFALPLGINNRRGGRASGFALSIAVIIVYYVLINNGEEAAQYGKLAPWVAMWAPNILLAAAGLFLLAQKNRDRGLQLDRIDQWVRGELWNRLLRLRRFGQERRRQRRDRERERQEQEGPRVLLRLPRISFFGPSLLDRYVISAFSKIFFLVLASGMSLFVIFDLSEIADDILKHKVSALIVFDYYKYLTIQIFYQISPIVVLVTTLITFSLLGRTNEITAIKALGLSLYRIALPALAAALFVTAVTGYLESGILPASNEKVAQLKDKIQNRQTARTYRRADRQWLFGKGRYIYNYTSYDAQQQSLQNLQVFEFDENHKLARRLFASSARYIGGGAWIFASGWARDFNGIDPVNYRPFTSPKVVYYPETPRYFDSEIRPPEQMGYSELKKYIEDLKESGQPVPELRVELYNKIAYPVIAFIMALVALPFAFRLGKQGALYGIGLSVFLGIVFMAVFAFFTKLGETGALPPILAVWSPGALFSLLSIYLFLGVKT